MRLVVLLLLAWTSLVPIARAQERAPAADDQARAQQELDDERAHAHYVAGESHFAAERWPDAVREFSLAYELSRRPEMLVNLSRAHERGGELEASIADLELLLQRYPETTYRLEAEQRIEVMRAKLAAPPPVEAAPAAPLPAIDVTPSPPARSIWPPRTPTLVVGSLALAAGVTALATGLRAHAIYNDLDGRCPGGGCPGAYESDRDRGQALSRASTATMFVSIALAGTTAALWVFDVKRERASSRSRFALGVQGAGAQLRAQF